MKTFLTEKLPQTLESFNSLGEKKQKRLLRKELVCSVLRIFIPGAPLYFLLRNLDSYNFWK